MKILPIAKSSTLQNKKMRRSSITKMTLLGVLCLTLSASRAQKEMAPIPASEIGQKIEIQSTDPLWTDFWSAAQTSKEAGQAALDSGADPTNYISCVNDVCCQTVEFWDALLQKWWLVTTCWRRSTGRELTTIVQ